MRPLMMMLTAVTVLVPASLIANPGSAAACAGLIGSNGAVNLGRTTTLAGYHDGVEHYITAFQFQGGGGEFGALIPLPGVPTNVERGGDWTLQRLVRETTPVGLAFLKAGVEEDALRQGAQVLQQVRIDALDITILKGGGPDVAVWAKGHGFRLSPDAPEMLDFYATRSPIFLAAVFDGQAALERGQQIGDGTPVHLTIPTSNPWVPLRILALGKQPSDRVEADVFLLTDHEPSVLPAPGQGLFLAHNAQANRLLLDDLRSDAGGGWVPESAWLTKLQVDSSAADLRFDLAVDPSGANSPSRVDAGFDLPRFLPSPVASTESTPLAGWAVLAAAVGVLAMMVVATIRPDWIRTWSGRR